MELFCVLFLVKLVEIIVPCIFGLLIIIAVCAIFYCRWRGRYVKRILCSSAYTNRLPTVLENPGKSLNLKNKIAGLEKSLKSGSCCATDNLAMLRLLISNNVCFACSCCSLTIDLKITWESSLPLNIIKQTFILKHIFVAHFGP